MKYNIWLNHNTQQYEINPSTHGAWDTIEQAQSLCDQENAKLAEKKNLSSSQIAEQAHSDAVHGIPSVKSLETLNAKLVAIKRAEEIENSDE